MAISARSSAWRAVDRVHVDAERRVGMRQVGLGRRRSLIHSALLGLGAGLLASCAANEPPPPPQTSAARALPRRAEAPPPPTTAPRPARKPTNLVPAGSSPGPVPNEAASEATGPRPTQGGAVAELSPSRSPPSGVPSQAELIGLDESAATRLLGPATEKSDQPPATVWHYKSANCELDLFFYLDLRSGRMRTLHYSVKGESGEGTQRQDCLRSLTASRER